jgi:hypothetical protein
MTGRKRIHERIRSFLPVGLIILTADHAAGSASPGPSAPDFGPHVHVFDPSMPGDEIQKTLDSVFAQQEHAQFDSGRCAFLFKPGEYNVDVNVGFYTEVLGLGESPDDTHITGAVRAEADWMEGNATCTFWRSCAGLAVTPTYSDATTEQGNNRWSVSQAAPFRRMHVRGNLILTDNGWASGGFIADSLIDGWVDPLGQQQWLSRNSAWKAWINHDGSWNHVFMGVDNPPAGRWPEVANTVVRKTPRIREKPFLVMDDEGEYYVLKPDPRRDDSRGISWAGGAVPGKKIPLEEFYVARAGESDAATMNAALAEGRHLLLTPGIYQIDEPLRVSRPGTIVLGIGYPTLVPVKGTPALLIADVDGVLAGGLLIDAGPVKSRALMIVGEEKSVRRHLRDPVCLYDIFCRVGGAISGQAACMLIINSNDVVGDHFWLWRADHGNGVGWERNINENALIVNGDHVTLYGLFAEHAQEYQTIWNGEYGRTVMYQSEFPYDPPGQEAWRHGDVNGWASYRVHPEVKHHQADGLGCYLVLNNRQVNCATAIEAPQSSGIQFRNMVTLWLRGGSLSNVINDQRGSLHQFGARRVLSYP